MAISIVGIAFSAAANDGADRVQPSAIVVVHTSDQIGIAGLAAVKSCAKEKISIVEEKAMEGTHSVLLVLHRDSAGRITGVHYGANDVCGFVQKATEKVAT